MMFCFEQAENGKLSAKRLLDRVKGGDIAANELAIGSAEAIEGLEDLKHLGIKAFPGVKMAFADILARVAKNIKDY